MSEICDLLPWDSAFFGRRIARLRGDTLDDARARAAAEWCAAAGVDCLYFLARTDDHTTVSAAEAHGFGLKDVRLTYSRRLPAPGGVGLPEPPEGLALRAGNADDVPALEEIAETAFTDTRFYFDQGFERRRVADLYRLWVRQSVERYPDSVRVLDQDGRASGFITCDRSADGTGQVGVAAVAASLRGRGLGQMLYQAALDWFARNSVASVTYVTQARNTGAQRLVQQLGFRITATQLWYHRWFSRAAAVVDKCCA